MWRWVIHQDLPLSLPLFITVVNLQEVADPNADPNLTLILHCNYTEAYRSLWVGYAWTTEPLFFTLVTLCLTSSSRFENLYSSRTIDRKKEEKNLTKQNKH